VKFTATPQKNTKIKIERERERERKSGKRD
jgi:hypothetical protein